MKRIVGSERGLSICGFCLALATVALTRASAGATYLITIGFLAVVIWIQAGPERIRLRHAKRSTPAVHHRPSPSRRRP